MRRAPHLLLLVLAILLSNGCVDTTADNAAQYKSDELGISFSYPANWHVSENNTGILVTTEASLDPLLDSHKYKEGQGIISLFVDHDVHMYATDPTDPLKIMNDSPLGTTGRMEEPRLVTLNGKTYALEAFDIDVASLTPNLVAVSVIDGNTMYVALFTSKMNESRFRAVFEQVLGSLELQP